MSDHDEMPFGEDIINPDAKSIPPAFYGQWSYQGDLEETIEADRLTFRNGDSEQVIAVRFIRKPVDDAGGIAMNMSPQAQIAIVTRQPGGEYALHYRGLSQDGAKMVNLESMEMKFDRC